MQPPPPNNPPEVHTFNTSPVPHHLPNFDLFPFDSNSPPSLPLFPEPSKPSPNIYEDFGLCGKPQLVPDGPYIGAIPDGYDPQRDATPLESLPEASQEGLVSKLLHLTERSSTFTIEGAEVSRSCIGGINGMDTILDVAKSHASYLFDQSGGKTIKWIHNQTHGKLVDTTEAALLNLAGFSPNTGKLLEIELTNFHEKNLKVPEAKYLLFCHSQGAIHVRNTLVNLPSEVRDRIIVIAIAPAVVVERELCYNSFNTLVREILRIVQNMHMRWL